ncbi:ferritin-like domain-containing protein [Clostridium sp. Marseille-P299]|uniref:ferritin-like domain-containing protein n=1 Tax=Clostridium sp. Marseille-P299 TaxID=1805477 RepID=UPI00082B50CF|nr:ferritin family protein [Clostridium sp. Marseille-P299]
MEILELALSMELDLEKFYTEQAELNKDNTLNVVFTMLAKEEENHANILMSKADKLTLPLRDSNILHEVQSIFKDMDHITSEFHDIPTQLDIYREALEKEQQSLKFYQDLHAEASEEQSKKVFQYLINQEDKHCIILEELVKLVSRPEEWVEDAEFGRREPY